MAKNATKVKKVWSSKDGVTPEIEYMVKKGRILIDTEYYGTRYLFNTKGKWVQYPKEFNIIFHDIAYDEVGNVVNLKYHFCIRNNTTWVGEDGQTPEIMFLMKNYNLIIDPDNFESMYRLKVNDKWLEYPNETKFLFRNIVWDKNGQIVSLRFSVKLPGSKIWTDKDGITPEIQFLKNKNHLVIDSDNSRETYRYRQKGKEKIKSYPDGSRIMFFDIIKDEEGNVTSLKFKFQQLKWV